jgi:hypothetical protein
MDFAKKGIMSYQEINRLDVCEFLNIMDNLTKENGNR